MVAEWLRDDHITLVANPKWRGSQARLSDGDHSRHPRSGDERAVDPEGRHRHAHRPAPRRREDARRSRRASRVVRAAVEQRELRRDGRGEEAVRRRARAPRGRVRDRRRDDGEEPVLHRRGRRRQLDAARHARREPGGESVPARRRQGARAARGRGLSARVRDDAELLDRAAPVSARAAARRRDDAGRTSRRPGSR